VFVILFLSTAFFPENLLLEPARSAAEWNPLSFIIEGIRDLVISTFSDTTFLEGIAALLSIGLFGLGLSAAAMRGRLRRGW
jgi:ABC-2 type transport system permease protein